MSWPVNKSIKIQFNANGIWMGQNKNKMAERERERNIAGIDKNNNESLDIFGTKIYSMIFFPHIYSVQRH